MCILREGVKQKKLPGNHINKDKYGFNEVKNADMGENSEHSLVNVDPVQEFGELIGLTQPNGETVSSMEWVEETTFSAEEVIGLPTRVHKTNFFLTRVKWGEANHRGDSLVIWIYKLYTL